jgi:hypothetical protein
MVGPPSPCRCCAAFEAQRQRAARAETLAPPTVAIEEEWKRLQRARRLERRLERALDRMAGLDPNRDRYLKKRRE